MSFADAPEGEVPPPDEASSAGESPKVRYYFLSEDRATVTPRPAGEFVDATLRAVRAQILRQRGGRLIVARMGEDGSYVDLAYASADGWRGPGSKPREPHRTLPRLPKIRRAETTRPD